MCVVVFVYSLLVGYFVCLCLFVSSDRGRKRESGIAMQCREQGRRVHKKYTRLGRIVVVVAVVVVDVCVP